MAGRGLLPAMIGMEILQRSPGGGPLISNEPQDSWESTPASLGNPSNDIDRDEAGCTFRGLEELSDLGLIGVIGDHRV